MHKAIYNKWILKIQILKGCVTYVFANNATLPSLPFVRSKCFFLVGIAVK